MLLHMVFMNESLPTETTLKLSFASTFVLEVPQKAFLFYVMPPAVFTREPIRQRVEISTHFLTCNFKHRRFFNSCKKYQSGTGYLEKYQTSTGYLKII